MSAMTLNRLFLFYIFGNLYTVSQAKTLQDSKNVLNDIMNGYEKHLLPKANSSTPVDVKLGFCLFTVNGFNGVDETLSLTGGLSMSWDDVSLQWNPASYGGVTDLVLDNSKIWHPYIFLVNTPNEMKPIGYDTNNVLSVYSSGRVAWFPGGVLKAKCSTDFTKFPFDTQVCTLEFQPWGTTSADITLSPLFDYVILDYFSTNSDWIVNSRSYVEAISIYSLKFNVEVTLTRRPLYYAVMLVVPTLSFCILNPLVFVLPPDSGERISYAVTILLSYAIFLTIALSSLPTSSDPLCTLLLVMILIIAISGAIVIFVIISMRYYHKESFKPGRCAACLIRVSRCTGKVKDTVIEFQKDDKIDIKIDISGKEYSHLLDRFFLTLSYSLLCMFLVLYICVVFV
ncbi:acetylcholine receptor subunit alpha-1-B-like [Mytilus galloprovincialis]|uniref:acetylcholine receptor subunit alpha-1-B-like n=1 Tax=Mytilus galloprovincialis TaxID=29158 RepID=UPI003F7BBC80